MGTLFRSPRPGFSVYDHGFLYGDGLFESIKAYNGRVFKLREHVDRLYDSAKAIAMDIRLTKDEMIEIILETRGKTILKILIFAL